MLIGRNHSYGNRKLLSTKTSCCTNKSFETQLPLRPISMKIPVEKRKTFILIGNLFSISVFLEEKTYPSNFILVFSKGKPSYADVVMRFPSGGVR